MAVAGFAAANVMLLSVSVWAGGAEVMGPGTRGLLHWFSALITLPAIAYAGRPFFISAIGALKARRTNMDVPIALAILLAAGLSLAETVRGGDQVYFESAIMLLFFLLIGRYLDRRARGKARHAAEHLLALAEGAITVLDQAGRARVIPAAEAEIGMTVLVSSGERVGVDGKVLTGATEVDSSLITGESLPARVEEGDPLFAGMINRGDAIRMTVSAVGEGTLLAEIVRLMELAEQRRARHVVLADRIAGWYAPLVHGLALLTFLGWTLLAGAAWQTALLYAIAVLIITCPCALGLAVPAVQVIASGKLLENGILLKSATALERLAGIDLVGFDTTGTLPLGRPDLLLPPDDGRDPAFAADLRLAASIAGASRHPLAQAVRDALPEVPVADAVEEVPGQGLRLATPEGEVRLGSRRWCGIAEEDADSTGMELWLTRPGGGRRRFALADPPRADARSVLRALDGQGLGIMLLSGDRAPAVARAAAELGIADFAGEATPGAKVRMLERLAASGRRVLMVGDGLNDAAALAAARVSLSPASAVDISLAAADAVFQGDRLAPVTRLLRTAKQADRLIRQNLALAFGYNLITIPLAVAGLVTPLLAAACMSASSLLVVGNALRLAAFRFETDGPAGEPLP
jgi:Cu2+-exporting ATPase